MVKNKKLKMSLVRANTSCLTPVNAIFLFFFVWLLPSEKRSKSKSENIILNR